MSNIEDTFPWHWTGAAHAVGGEPYAIGVIVSEPFGCAIVSVGYDGPNPAENIEKADLAGKYIVDTLNALHRQG